MAELRQQQTLLKTHIQGEVALASSECTHQLESAQYAWRQKALMMDGQAQSESVTVAKLQAHSSQVDSCNGGARDARGGGGGETGGRGGERQLPWGALGGGG